ncbi:MAG: S9 family peptidase [Proteobacteria bacterium]|nr:S9 family peptidase [Pseudomonadota bacterium]
MRFGLFATIWALLAPAMVAADDRPAFDPAVAFGARRTVSGLHLSPDGKSVSYLMPLPGQGSQLVVYSFEPGAKPKVAARVGGNPDRLTDCEWLSNTRLVCTVYGTIHEKSLLTLQYMSRRIAIDADGGNMKVLARPTNGYTRGYQYGGDRVVDWVPDHDGVVVMARIARPDSHLGSRLGTEESGLAVDRVDSRTLQSTTIEPPNPKAIDYLGDGRGTVRVMYVERMRQKGMDTAVVDISYRRKGSRVWEPLSTYDYVSREGFEAVAVDPDRDVVYGFQKLNGRRAVYTISLDGSRQQSLVYARDDVDVDGLIRVGREGRVVGVSYVTERRHGHFIDSSIEGVIAGISKALPGQPAIEIVDASLDGQKLLIFAASDVDAGVYGLYDRSTKHLETLVVARSLLEGVKLAPMKPLKFAARDGVEVPAYLTLPPGAKEAKSLPAVVMPHGGPGARDEWGFDYLVQFLAARGYAVLQPNFRGSAGYGDDWYEQNGFRSWPSAVGDVLDGGRWLVKEGIADPARLSVVGWSYGGYAALQAAVTDPEVFKSVVAIAPVTDLESLRESFRRWSNFRIMKDFIGEGPEVRAGSPAQNAAKIRVPVLLFHGTEDSNVEYAQSELMDKALSSAKVPHELVTFEHLDHQLDDSAARASLLRKVDEFLSHPSPP